MKRSRIRLLLSFALLLLARQTLSMDLRQQFDTTSSQCATAIDKAIKSSEAGNSKDALEYARKAVEYDPGSTMALYWLATINIDRGDVENGIKYFKRTIATSQQRRGGQLDSVAADACINLGLIFAKLGELDEARYWFSKEIILDPKDNNKLHWKAYRNMAIASFNSGDASSATIQALKAKQAAPTRVSAQMIRDFRSQIGSSVAFTLLTPFKTPPSPRPKRTYKSDLKRLPNLESSLNKMDSVTGMAYIFKSNSILIFSNSTKDCMLVSADTRATKKITLPEPIKKAEAPGNNIFALTATGTSLLELSPNGSLLKSHKLPNIASDMAICPLTRQAFLAINKTVHVLNLDSGRIVETELLGQLVACDYAHGIVFSAYKNNSQYESGHILIGGQPIFFHQTPSPDKDLDIVMQGVYNKTGHITLCAIREKAAWNSYSLDVSPAGDLVTVTGGGGYRGPGGGGYGTGVFFTHSLGKLEGFYPCKAYSKSALFNPSTHQMALLGSSEIHVYDLGSKVSAFTEQGSFNGVASWSPDGSLLLSYVEKEGIRAYDNLLSSKEKAAYNKARKQEYEASFEQNTNIETSSSTTEKEALPSLIQFSPSGVLSVVKRVANEAVAIDHTKSQGMPRWYETPLYDPLSEITIAVKKLRKNVKPSDAGISLFKVKKLLEKNADFAPALLLYSQLLVMTGQHDSALEPALKALRSDAGRSDLSSEALLLMGKLFLHSKEEVQALHCLATALCLDAGYIKVRETASELFRKQGLELSGQEKKTTKNINGKAGISPPSQRLEFKKTLTGEQIYNIAASRTVSIQTDRNLGSGVCITERGHILTCSHVVPDSSREIEITTYSITNGTLSKSYSTTASVIYRDSEADIAILKPNDQLDSLKYLSISKSDAKTGERIFTLGSPGMGYRQLPQSLSQGIVSSGKRLLDGQLLVQHTAAVNPGNSGGPMISETGEILGIIVKKTELENVAFAIPASIIKKSLGWELE